MNSLARFHRVFDYIDAHLDEEIPVDVLSDVACLSKYHFHRQFSALFGISVCAYIRLIRMKRASYQLAFRQATRSLDVALGCGYESSEAFSRAFSQSLGQSPSRFRKRPDWNPWYDRFQILMDMRAQHMLSGKHDTSVALVDFPQTRVAVLEHRGDPKLLGDTIRTFIEWRKENKLPPGLSKTYNLVYDDPLTTDPDKYRLDICAQVKTDVEDNPYGVITKTIPAGRCARLRHIGTNEHIAASINYLYGEWLAQNDEELRDFPLFFERVTLFPDVPEHETITDIYLPLK